EETVRLEVNDLAAPGDESHRAREYALSDLLLHDALDARQPLARHALNLARSVRLGWLVRALGDGPVGRDQRRCDKNGGKRDLSHRHDMGSLSSGERRAHGHSIT